ncbi:dual OB domain-containing protein [Methylotetracoccus oryzae]|uniref:dual OB domain-containing protein n=1 Tax=Methylotetracoccus oryzae TaxID=1919059 RepID=UPI0038B2D994
MQYGAIISPIGDGVTADGAKRWFLCEGCRSIFDTYLSVDNRPIRCPRCHGLVSRVSAIPPSPEGSARQCEVKHASTRVTRIICLATSRKCSGRCIAGKTLGSESFGAVWVRPVSGRPSHEISDQERRYANGHAVKLLEILDVPCLYAQPDRHQSENILIDDRCCWTYRGTATSGLVTRCVDEPEPLWTTGYSTLHGRNDRVPEHLLDPGKGSLRFIALNGLTLDAGPKAPQFGNQKFVVRASFDYAGSCYTLDVTDPIWESECCRRGQGRFSLGPVLACISLGTLWEGYAYKLVASIIEPSMTTR